MTGTATFGSISTGTLRAADLIDTFSSELSALMPEDAASHVDLCANADAWLERNAEDGAESEPDHLENGDELVCDLIDALQEYAPAYGYFGAHPGDGADFGFWLSEDWQQDATDNGALEVEDTSDVPADYCGEVVHVNDHGNATLYLANNGALSEVWSIV